MEICMEPSMKKVKIPLDSHTVENPLLSRHQPSIQNAGPDPTSDLEQSFHWNVS